MDIQALKLIFGLVGFCLRPINSQSDLQPNGCQVRQGEEQRHGLKRAETTELIKYGLLRPVPHLRELSGLVDPSGEKYCYFSQTKVVIFFPLIPHLSSIITYIYQLQKYYLEMKLLVHCIKYEHLQ